MISQEELRRWVIGHGCLSLDENQQIYESWFLKAPRYLFRALDRKYGITKKVLCDVGCAYGANLFYCASGSYGIDIQEHKADFAVSLGLKVYQRDVVKDDLSDLPRADVVWCSAVLEHVDCPHIFLRKLVHLLRPKGILALYVPTIPLFPVLQKLPKVGKYLSGYSANEHVNAFVPKTLQFCCERAGFRTIEISPFYPSPFQLLNHVPLFNRLIGRSVYIGRKIENC